MNSILEKVFPYTLLGKEYTSKPTDLTERTNKFKELWDSWEHTNIQLPANLPNMAFGSARFLTEPATAKVKKFASKHSLTEFWHYQVRGNAVRFADENTALLFRLTL
jgi:hypothetical protein